MDIAGSSPEIALVIGAVVIVLVAAFTSRAWQWVTIPIALAALVAASGASIGLAIGGEQRLSFERAWSQDGVTHGAELLICAVTAICLVAGADWFTTDTRRGELPAIMLFCATGAMLLAGATDTMEIVVAMLLVSVTGYTLATYHRASPAAVEAGMKYFLVGALTNTALLLGVVVLYGTVGTTNLAAAAAALSDGADQVAVAVAVACITIGLAFEIGAVPAHFWVPDVAQAAPAPSAAFLTVVPKIGAVVALARFLHAVPDTTVAWRPMIAIVAVVTMTLGNLLALWQDDVRRMLGWSAVSQAGYALIAVVVVGRSDMAEVGLIVFLAGYAAANTTAFAVVIQLRGRSTIADYRGLGHARPWLAAALAIALLSLVGVPPLGGFIGKLTVFTAAIDAGYGWLAAVAVANTVISLFYYLRVIAPMYLDTTDDADHNAHASARTAVLGRSAACSVGIAATATIAIGLAAGPLMSALRRSFLLP